ncbi:hypothetical protein EDB81DRAFT_887478 [Dactylonectria macrodidyma]|uniref:Uncharacterized protein n=1 Tax=Dactylonectria macrodidyma TaxID=307937 RepID=A0A9P9E887_9HYPO|nr:hypothetical protein EDB81DRAFT_887478 [Dactylonectria macrodidyma]
MTVAQEKNGIPKNFKSLTSIRLTSTIEHLLATNPLLRWALRDLIDASRRGDHVTTPARARTADLPGRKAVLSVDFIRLSRNCHEALAAAEQSPGRRSKQEKGHLYRDGRQCISYLVVRRLSDDNNNLQRLCYKRNELCGIRPRASVQEHAIFYYDETAIAAKACQSLWLDNVDNVDHAPPLPNIDAETLMRLSQGLRANALPNTIISEDMYQSFVVIFCYRQAGKPNDAKERDRGIKDAYSAAFYSARDRPNIRPPPASNSSDEHAEALIPYVESQVQIGKYLVDSITALMRAERSQTPSGHTIAPKMYSLPDLLRDMADTTDWDDLRDKLNHFVQFSTVQNHAKLGLVLEMLQTELAGNIEFRDQLLGVQDDGDDDIEIDDSAEFEG